MTTQEAYIQKVLDRLPAGQMRKQIATELHSHIADRVERDGSVEEALLQLGDPVALADSYLAAVPLVRPLHGRRVAAKLVDLTLFFPIALMAFAWSSMPRVIRAQESLAIALAAIGLLSVFVAFVYIIVAEHRSGQTIGKRLFGLQVVTESGARISLSQSFIRQLPVLLEIWPVDALFVFFNEPRQRGFEMISKTRVVDVRESRRANPIAQGALA